MRKSYRQLFESLKDLSVRSLRSMFCRVGPRGMGPIKICFVKAFIKL